MAITTVDMTMARVDRSGKTPFAVFFTSADLSGTEIIKAVTGFTNIYLKKFKLWTVAPGLTVTLGIGETSGAVTTVIAGPIPFVVEDDVGTPANERNYAHPVSFDYEFAHRDGTQLTDDKDLTIDASGSGVVCGICEGFLA
ncbi:MAG: hypothetical protein ACXABY_07385 [Candidatus Thorarchaeota archaeon]|jgi:hypothetical protein